MENLLKFERGVIDYGFFKKQMFDLYSSFGRNPEDCNFAALAQICKNLNNSRIEVLCQYLIKKVVGSIDCQGRSIVRQPSSRDFEKGIYELSACKWSIENSSDRFSNWY